MLHHCEGDYGDWRDNHILSTAYAGPGGAKHIYGQGGNDVLQLDFAPSTRSYWHGHHVRGDADLATDRGRDVFNFTNIRNVQAGTTVVGRIEDLDYTRDKIQIEGRNIDLFNPPKYVKIVEFNGAHNDPGALPQQWLLITTPTGGKIFYALEGARADMNGDGISNNGNSEAHFVDREFVPDFNSLKEVKFVYKHNYVPEGMSAEDGIVFNDDDMMTGGYLNSDGGLISNGSVQAAILGTNGGDLLAGGLNNDVISGLNGNDRMWGGSGQDVLRGGNGHDMLAGGMGNDRLLGGSGEDHLSGESGNDRLIGGTGADHLDGGEGIDTVDYASATALVWADLLKAGVNRGEAAGDMYHDVENLAGTRFADDLAGDNAANVINGNGGNDRIQGRMGNDVLNGGAGNDELKSGRGSDIASGGAGADVFVFATNHDRFLVRDFQDDIDTLDLRPFDFSSRAEAMSHATQSGRDVIFDFGGGDVLTIRNAEISDFNNDLLI